MHEMADKLLKQVDAGFSTYVKARELGTAQKQLVEIAKALRIHSNIIVMDEPTAALSQREVESLFRLIRNLKSQRIAVIYISHRGSYYFTRMKKLDLYTTDAEKIRCRVNKAGLTGIFTTLSRNK